jgi:hypothetical protein
MSQFYPSDFGALDTLPLHMDLVFDVLESHVTVTATTTFVHKGAAPLTVLK